MPAESVTARVASLQTLQSPLFMSALAPVGVRHGFSTRVGGSSLAYRRPGAGTDGELNLGFTLSDDRQHVLANRDRLLADVFGATRPLVTLRQVHSALLHRVGLVDAGDEATLPGDGVMTADRGIAIGMQTADCVPVLVADRRTGAVAAFHAGWRGTLARIVEHGVARMRVEFGCAPADLVAAVGPAIGPCCYQVGEEVEQQFRQEFDYAESLLHKQRSMTVRKEVTGTSREGGSGLEHPGLYLDLQEANRRQLTAAGIAGEAIEVMKLCTECRQDLFFSYRGAQGSTGRMMAVIGRD